jgi:hypothetical protein
VRVAKNRYVSRTLPVIIKEEREEEEKEEGGGEGGTRILNIDGGGSGRSIRRLLDIACVNLARKILIHVVIIQLGIIPSNSFSKARKAGRTDGRTDGRTAGVTMEEGRKEGVKSERRKEQHGENYKRT